MKTVITFGTFDVFHVGHVNILERAREYGDKLIVGVSSDALNFSKKKRYPIFDEAERMQIIKSLHCVDDVFLEESLELKVDYLRWYKADILVMGDDWKGRFDEFQSTCDVCYLPRTEGISTTDLISKIVSRSFDVSTIPA